ETGITCMQPEGGSYPFHQRTGGYPPQLVGVGTPIPPFVRAGKNSLCRRRFQRKSGCCGCQTGGGSYPSLSRAGVPPPMPGGVGVKAHLPVLRVLVGEKSELGRENFWLGWGKRVTILEEEWGISSDWRCQFLYFR